MPLPDICENCPDPCCTVLYNGAHALLEAAWSTLEQCLGSDCCEGIQRFVAAAEPHLAAQDYLSVYFVSTDIPVPFSRTSQTKGLAVQAPATQFGVKLVESGYPVLEAELTEVYEPEPLSLDTAGLHFLGHVEQIYRGVINHLAANNVCGALKSVGSLRTVTGGGSIGGQFTVTVELAWT